MMKIEKDNWWLDVFLWIVIIAVVIVYACNKPTTAQGQENEPTSYVLQELPCRPGVLFATRNHPTVGNPSPGHWNHIAVMGTNGWVIEAQAEPGQVIAVPFWVFYYRYPEIVAFRVCPSKEDGIAQRAQAQLGNQYDRRKNNCVSVAKEAVRAASPLRPGWRKPDHVLRWSREVLWHKVNYRKWRPIPDPYAGMTTDIGRVHNVEN